jgi:hypothetical protein
VSASTTRKPPAPDPALARGILDKIAACPELGGDILGWALTVGSGACAIGMSGNLLDYAIVSAPPAPWGIAPPGLNHDEDPLQVDPLDDPEPPR